jgi:tRNA 2-thiouridine synthesizing protein A
LALLFIPGFPQDGHCGRKTGISESGLCVSAECPLGLARLEAGAGLVLRPPEGRSLASRARSPWTRTVSLVRYSTFVLPPLALVRKTFRSKGRLEVPFASMFLTRPWMIGLELANSGMLLRERNGHILGSIDSQNSHPLRFYWQARKWLRMLGSLRTMPAVDYDACNGDNRIVATKTLDFRGLKCPEPTLKMAVESYSTPPGDILDVVADCPTFEDDIRNWCQRQKKSLLWMRQEGPAKRCQIRI